MCQLLLIQDQMVDMRRYLSSVQDGRDLLLSLLLPVYKQHGVAGTDSPTSDSRAEMQGFEAGMQRVFQGHLYGTTRHDDL